MAKKKDTKTMIKVVYFDEGSVTDFIYVLDGGKTVDKEEHIVKKTTELAAGAEAQANTKLGFITMIASKVGIEGSADIAREGSTIITKAVENTILTDYLSFAKGDGKEHIRVFSNCKPYPYPESFAYYKMLTPYLIMTEGKVRVADDLNINLAMMDKALDSGRGYYELMAEEGKEMVVLRFNIKAFRNNYSIADLIKMNLDYHAIEVGSVKLSNLTMQSEFGGFDDTEISGYDIANERDAITPKEVKVYDVILAGVCK